jgi:hypothetical protein
MSIVGFHFRFDLRLNWKDLVGVFDERAKLLGCTAPGASLKPFAERAVVSGTVDERLTSGKLRYDIVLHRNIHEVVDVRLGITGEHIHIRFGVGERIPETWCSNETVGLSSAGLFVPEQRTADNSRNLPAVFFARLDLWDTVARLAKVACGAPVPDTGEFPGAPDWKFLGQSNDRKLVLDHPLAGLSFSITPMEEDPTWRTPAA